MTQKLDQHGPRIPLLLALGGNALFSLVTGVLLATAPDKVAGWLDVSISGWLRLLGVALVGHALVLLVVSRSSDLRPWTRLNLAAIAPYPVLMLIVVVAGWVTRPLGVGLVLFDGLVVLALGAMHLVGLRETVALPQTQAA